jgi:site-specific recombinase XerD
MGNGRRAKANSSWSDEYFEHDYEDAEEVQREYASWDEAFRRFMLWKSGDLTEKGIAYYKYHVSTFREWAKDQKISTSSLCFSHIDAYKVYRRDGGISSDTIFKDLKCIKNFTAYCRSVKIWPKDVLRDYQIKKPVYNKIEAPTKEEVVQYAMAVEDLFNIELCSSYRYMPEARREYYRARVMTLICLAIDTGARISELAQIRFRDIPDTSSIPRDRNPVSKRTIDLLLSRDGYDTETQFEIKLRFTKVGKVRDVPVSFRGMRIIKEFLIRRSKAWTHGPDDYVFCADGGGETDVDHLRRTIRLAKQRAGIEGQISFQALRHYTLTVLANDNLQQAQEIAGHSDPNTTQIYVSKDNQKKMQVHAKADVLNGILHSVEAERHAKRRVAQRAKKTQ